MVARRSGRNSRAAHGAKSPIVQSAIRRWRNPRGRLRRPHGPRRRPLWSGRWGPFFLLGVGAGIPDGPGWNVPWTRQGCRVLQNGYVFAPMRRSTLPSTARRHTPVPPYKRGRTAPLRLGAGTSSDTVQHKAAVHHPRWGGDSGLRRCRGLRHLRMAVWDA